MALSNEKTIGSILILIRHILIRLSESLFFEFRSSIQTIRTCSEKSKIRFHFCKLFKRTYLIIFIFEVLRYDLSEKRTWQCSLSLQKSCFDFSQNYDRPVLYLEQHTFVQHVKCKHISLRWVTWSCCQIK